MLLRCTLRALESRLGVAPGEQADQTERRTFRAATIPTSRARLRAISRGLLPPARCPAKGDGSGRRARQRGQICVPVRSDCGQRGSKLGSTEASVWPRSDKASLISPHRAPSATCVPAANCRKLPQLRGRTPAPGSPFVDSVFAKW